MARKKQKDKISTFGSRLTAVVSVTLVLLILGLLAATFAASGAAGDNLRRNIGFIVKITPTASDTEINTLKRELSRARFTESIAFTSAEQILITESELMGERIDSLIGSNPFGPEIDLKVKPEYASGDSISALAARVAKHAAVDEVVTEASVADNVNTVVSKLMIVLGSVGLVLLIISFVLINNTVSLAVYSRRFIIHTMKLVGATGAFIRAPFLRADALTGLAASVAACAILAGARCYLGSLYAEMDVLIPWPVAACILGGILALGPAICTIASLFATNRYLRADYDEMFK